MKTVQLTDEQCEALLGLGVIQHYQIVETPTKELKAWEKYPTLESCGEGYGYNVGPYSGNIDKHMGNYNYSTEAEAKRARATIKLSRIARKWNEGVDREDKKIYFIFPDFTATCGILNPDLMTILPFYFHSHELAEKSLEMFEQDWKDFYGK